MPEYKIKTKWTGYTNYFLEADNEKEAEERFYNGDYDGNTEEELINISMYNEEVILYTKEIKKKTYEVLVTNTTGELWQIEAENEDEANNNYADGELIREETIVCDVEQVNLVERKANG